MKTIEISTTLGTVSIPVSDAVVSYESCGIWYTGEISVAMYTSADKSSGYIVYQSISSGHRRLKRIQRSYIDAASAAKYGRRCVRETLPIIKS